ncbi:MAG: glycerol-3-phosphate 1-O-acyltransferase PlsY [Clostridia bacterium]|nr:glycerol-3-phosphate 1-O-acyltransferase PlsY [Clostridia bacterium]
MEIYDILVLVFGCIISYFLGGISIARMLTKKENNDISKQGSGNPGTMNMMRNYGIVMGVVTLVCDALKGVLPALFGLLYFRPFDESFAYMVVYLFGFFAVLGHIFPIYYKFKGGKGIATTLGVFMVADPITGAILFSILFVTLYFIKISSVVSLLFIVISAVVQCFKPYAEANWLMIALMWVIVVLDIWAHRSNLLRLIDHNENPADLQEGLRKDIEKFKNKKEKKLEKNKQKHTRIEEKYDKKIERKHSKVSEKLKRLDEKSTQVSDASQKDTDD